MHWFFYMNGYKHLTSVDFLAKMKMWCIPLLFLSRQLGCRPLTCEINNHTRPRYSAAEMKIDLTLQALPALEI